MTPSDVKTVVANLDDFIELPDGIERLRKAVLTLAVSGKLVPQDLKEGTAETLFVEIQKAKEPKTRIRNRKNKEIRSVSLEEAPFEIPQSWLWARLPDIYDSLTPPTKVKTKDMESEGKYPVIDQGERFIAGYTSTGRPLHVSRPVVIFGDHTRHVKLITFDFVAGADGIKVLLPYINPAYFVFLLQQFKPQSRGYGRHFKQLNERIVPLPPLAEQERIVQKLDELMKQLDDLETRKQERDEVRARLTQSAMRALGIGNKALALELLPELVKTPEDVQEFEKAVLTLAVSGRLLLQDPKEGTGDDLYKEVQRKKEESVPRRGKKQKDTALGPITAEEIPFQIPKSWKWVRLGELFDVQRGGSPRPIKSYLTEDADGLNWIKIGDSEQGSQYIYSTKEKIRPDGLKKTRRVAVGDLLLTNSMSYGRPYILKTDGCIHDGWLALRPYSKGLDTDYMFYLLSSGYCQSQFDTLAAGAVVQNLNAEKVAETLITLPPTAEQKRIVEKVAALKKDLKQLHQILV